MKFKLVDPVKSMRQQFIMQSRTNHPFCGDKAHRIKKGEVMNPHGIGGILPGEVINPYSRRGGFTSGKKND